MATRQERKLRLFDFDRKQETSGEMTVVGFSVVERWGRSAKFFFIFFGLGVVAVFIPVLHFILVPLFAFAAVISGALIFLQKEKVERCAGVCPYCGKPTELKQAVIGAEFRDSCTECRQLIFAVPRS